MMSADGSPTTLSVVIPTFQRPVWIRRAVGSLVRQTRPPDEVVVVMRDTDEPTHRSVAEMQQGKLPFALRSALVSEPGFLPPVQKGLSVASSEVIAVMDDDAEALDSLVERILAHYRDASVGGVGGRCINTIGQEFGDSSSDVIQEVPETDDVGRVTLWGRFVGNMYKRPTFKDPIDVDFMMGGCMSFRREIARALEFDMELNHNVADGYEVDLGLQVKARGMRIIFDPAIGIHHYSAPRQVLGLRAVHDPVGVQWAAYNHTRVALRRLPLARRMVAVSYMFAIGNRGAPGLIPFALSPISRHMGFRVWFGGAAFRGRFAAVRRRISELISS